MTRAAASTNTPSILMSNDELAALVEADVRVTPEEKARCVNVWQEAMTTPLATCASCGVREPPSLLAPALESRSVEETVQGAAAEPLGEADASWAHLEVGEAVLCNDHPAPSALVGSDVCLLRTAYPDTPVRADTVGWRAQVTRQRRARGGRQVQLFGHWFALAGPCVKPLQQVRTAAPRAITQSRPPVVKDCCTWYSLDAFDVLRMTSFEWQRWTTTCARLGTMPLLGPTGQSMGVVEPARVCSVYTRADGGAPYYLHPEFVDNGIGGCLLCRKCAHAVDAGRRPDMNVSNVDYGWLGRLPSLEPLSVLEELLLSPHRLYHVVVKVRGG